MAATYSSTRVTVRRPRAVASTGAPRAGLVVASGAPLCAFELALVPDGCGVAVVLGAAGMRGGALCDEGERAFEDGEALRAEVGRVGGRLYAGC